jgi:3-methyladenine DNA glycosylase AlkD
MRTQTKTKWAQGHPPRIPLPTAAEVAHEIASCLRQMGDPVRARGAQRYFKEAILALGITAPALRGFVRERVKALRPGWQAHEAITLCDRLLREPEMEVRVAGILILGAFQRELTLDLLKPAARWLEHRLDNWALVDCFCSSVLSPLLERFPQVEDTLASWSRAESLWLRRAALVTFIPSARRGRRLGTAYHLARAHFNDCEDLMHKATGWLLREAGKTDMQRLRRFLFQHGPAIPRTALRYAIERFSASERAELLQTTRAPRKGRE